MKKFITALCFFVLAIVTRADIVQLNNGKMLSGRVTGYANESFDVESSNAAALKVPAATVTSIDFSKGAVLADVEFADQKSRHGQIWLYARGTLNFDDDKGETTRIPLAKVSRVLFSAEPLPEKPAPPPRPKPVIPTVAGGKVEIISRGDLVDIQKYCAPGKITIVDFYADWCGPCRQIGPMLEERVEKDSDLVLRKINIVNWSSPVSKQYSIRAVPCIQVYDRRGNKVGELTGFNNTVFESFISRAR